MTDQQPPGELRLVPLDPTGADRDALVEFLTTNEFPFHMSRTWTADDAQSAIEDGDWSPPENLSFWLVDDGGQRLGVLRLEDLEDMTPVFDLRLAGEHRGRGLGQPALRVIAAHVFETMPQFNRLEGQTREDNIAMRRTFLRCGWLKEAHYREAWPDENGQPLASVAYAILRRDWETGTTTSFEWEDLRL